MSNQTLTLLHTADWHLGKRLGEFARLPEQAAVLNEIVALADKHNPDVVVVAGDLFDVPNPPAEATELLYKTLHRLSQHGKRAVVAIAGNHDQPDRIAAPDPLARINGIFMLGYPWATVPTGPVNDYITVSHSQPGFFELQLMGGKPPLRIMATPFANEQRLRKALDPDNKQQAYNELLQQHWQNLAPLCNPQGVNILTGHLYACPPNAQANEAEETDGERTLLALGTAEALTTDRLPHTVQYVALGHLHRPHTVPTPKGGPLTNYSGSPLAYSFAEAGQTKSVCLVELQTAAPPKLTRLPLTQGKPLIRKKFESTQQAIEWLNNNQHALVEITISTAQFISAEENKAVMNAHPGIVGHIIPDIQNAHEQPGQVGYAADLNKSIPELFYEYFEQSKGNPPDPAIKSLFKEIMSAEPNDDSAE